MPLEFDATLKDLAKDHSRDFAVQFRLPRSRSVSVLNVDLSTITAATDVVLGHGEPLRSISDLNFQASRDPALARRVLLYHALLHYQYDVPVHTVVVLLRSEANDTGLKGKIRYQAIKKRGKMDFTFEVVRMWRLPVERMLTGPLGTVPLAPLCRLPRGRQSRPALQRIVDRVVARITREAENQEGRRLLTTAYMLTGLRVTRAIASRLFQGVQAMRESTTYMGILAEEAQKILLRQGRIRFGPPAPRTESAILNQWDVDRLERMCDHMLTATSWDDVLATP